MTTSVTTTYPCQHKKQHGIITLSQPKLQFQSQPPHNNTVDIPWNTIQKHLVSPVSHSKHLLKIMVSEGGALTFEFNQRQDLERIRKDITARLHSFMNNKKRSLEDMQKAESQPAKKRKITNNFSDLDPDDLAVIRASILATDQSLRTQHKFLVLESKTLSEDDFWSNHTIRVAEEAAKIHGKYRPGMGSAMRSNLDFQSAGGGKRGKVKLGVEEMRQIFILYPAVHKAYEEKVPLELSEEQFWRRYLESEFFHRDRGRIGMGLRQLQGQKNPITANNSNNPSTSEKDASAKEGGTAAETQGTQNTSASDDKTKQEEEKKQDDRDEPRSGAVAIGSEDIFSRYDAEILQRKSKQDPRKMTWKKRLEGKDLAVGQFDLSSSLQTERSRVCFATNVDTTTNADDSSTPSRIIDKYNRHWAMVLNPDEAVAGCELMDVARKSTDHVVKDDKIADVGGGLDDEMYQLVSFASTDALHADHVKCSGDDPFLDLELKNANAYSGQYFLNKASKGRTTKDSLQRRADFAKVTLAKIRNFTSSKAKNAAILPPPPLGKELLQALTKKMTEGSRAAEAHALKMTHTLPPEFKKDLNVFFRRTSELLRHFFGYRKNKEEQKKLQIVQAMETVYREMETMRRELPQTKEGEVMRKMCLPIMDQLDWAFKLHRDTKGGGGGFVTVELIE